MRNKRLLPLVLVATFALVIALDTQAQYATCIITKAAHNRNRKVLAPVSGVHISVECSWPHSVPWGIWGVSSNVGGVSGKNQFKGWAELGSLEHREWNSCTSDYPPINCTYYNDANCTKQITDHGINTYGQVGTQYTVSCPRRYTDGTWRGGCKDFEGNNITLSQNFMTLYEKDLPDADDLVQSLYFPNLSRTLSGCDAWGCPEQGSSWVSPTSYDTPAWPALVDAQIAITVRAELFESPPYGDCDDWICPPCDPNAGCEPCFPRYF